LGLGYADGIAVEGFQATIVNRHQIEIAPLPILAGANSSPASLLLKQTLEAQSDPGPLQDLMPSSLP
jgi:hypothetical protein